MSSEQTGESSQVSQSQSPLSTKVQSQESQINTPSARKPFPESGTQTTADTGEESHIESELDSKPSAKLDQPSDVTSPSTPEDPYARPRQVIAVSASKGPAAFFNLARKFLVTDEMCDLSALEGAIVSAADAAHLLERSKLATIVRVQTSYVTVEPKRKRQAPSPQPGQVESALPPGSETADLVTSNLESVHLDPTPQPAPPGRQRPSATARELRRARIIITVKRTESYRQWLEENPLHAMVGGEDEDGDGDIDDNSIHGAETSSYS